MNDQMTMELIFADARGSRDARWAIDRARPSNAGLGRAAAPFLAATAFAGLWATSPTLAQDVSGLKVGLQQPVVFSEYPDFSRSIEVARRTLSPLANAEIMRASAGSGLRSQAIDLRNETFSVYVPRKRPSQGYGVLVFIPPWQDARLPAGWGSVLDDSGLIFVCASKSGNEESIIDRRIPLALLGAHNIIHSYPIDADRVYVGGFSGGARVAMRVALAYPDVFRGALLNAGSDPIGNRDAVLPPDELFGQFQSSSRIVYVTGSEDSLNMNKDMGSVGSMNAWCVFGTHTETMFRVGHAIATASPMRWAVAALDQRSPVDASKLAACRSRIAKEMAIDLGRVAHWLDLDMPHEAWRRLSKIDARYAGLASRQILEFDRRIKGHGKNAEELQSMTQRGLTTMEAIRAATISAAELIGWSNDIGALETGKFADLIAVEGDPITDIAQTATRQIRNDGRASD